MHFLEKYVTIKIKDRKILVRMSALSSKLDEDNVSYACKYNSSRYDFHVFRCISSLYYHIILHFFGKYLRIKIKDHKIHFLMRILSKVIINTGGLDRNATRYK